MNALRERVVARLLAAQNARDPAPLREPDAAEDAVALLRLCTPSPTQAIDLDPVAAVFWTFWLRHEGPEDPDAPRNMMVVGATFGFLELRVPEHVLLPEPLRESFDPADPIHDARFSYLVCAAHSELLQDPDLAEADRQAALDRALAWSGTARELLPQDHEGYVELVFQALGIEVLRFQLTADPEALLAAAHHGREVCERLPSAASGAAGPVGAEAAELALGVVVEAAQLLGEPALAEVEAAFAAAPAGAVTPEAAAGLRFLRELDAEPTGWPGERDLSVGAALAEAGIREHDAGRIACAVRRLRAALADTPAGHPAHGAATAALGQALEALGRERGDAGAASEAAELLASVGGAGALADAEDLALYGRLQALADGDDPQNAGPAMAALVDRLRANAARRGGPADIDLETLAVVASIATGTSTGTGTGTATGTSTGTGTATGTSTGTGTATGTSTGTGPVSDQQIDRYRAALAAVPSDAPDRYGYVVLLAALAGARADELRETEPSRAARLEAEARALTEQAAATAPAGLPVLGLLRKGRYELALQVAVLTVCAPGPDGATDPETALTVSRLTRVADIRLDDPENLDSDIAVIRELLAGTAQDEDPALRAHLSAALGAALSARGSSPGDPDSLGEIVELLRDARSHTTELSPGMDEILARSLTIQAAMTLDPEAAREGAFLLAASAAEAEPGDIHRAVVSAHTRLHNAVQIFLSGHEPGRLDQAREIAQEFKELARAASEAGEQLPGLDVMADAYEDLLATVGPGGGPKAGITEEQVEGCRLRFAACPPGHGMRIFTATTLMRVLTLHALEIRTEDPGRAELLVGEAGRVLDEAEADAPSGWSEQIRTFIALVGLGVAGRHLPPVSPDPTPAPHPASPAPSPATPSRLFDSLMKVVQDRLAGVAPTAPSDPGLPAWIRANTEIASAAGALGPPRPRIDLALSHLAAAVETMPGITDRGSDQQSAEFGLTSFEGSIRKVVQLVLMAVQLRDGPAQLKDRLETLARRLEEAAAEQRLPEPLPALGSALRTVTGPDVERAAELLERGRGFLLSRRIEARADLGDLRSAHPGLAHEFEQLTDVLTTEPAEPAVGDPGGAERARLAGLRASRALDELVVRIRTQPGFEDFLRPPTAEQLRALAADGPVIVLNHASDNCHALVVTARSITARHLDIGAAEVTEAARQLREAVDAINAQGSSRRTPAELVAAGAAVRRTLSWTWHKIVRPVLDLAGAGAPAADGASWPRIWWVPTGAFNALPLHAAQCTRPDCEYDGCGAALDTVVSSYVPGFQTLAYARARSGRRDTSGVGGALLVASPEDDLPGVASAARYAAGLLGASEPLVGAAATREAVLAALGTTPWAHFGCHATTDPAEPSGALLHLPSGEPLSVLDICRARPRAARLAFLTACSTARTSDRLADEAIHVTSAFLLAGFPTAVGTLWEIDSTHADQVTRAFYRRAAADDADTPALALHHAVRELRERIPDRPHVWAAYVHAGA
ncbi:CHAT domain-containing protein [Streptomyces lavendulae]|uniref:CHAT domain-containing protein n=1 Tax=Streptomyces lavendulae TaxID=1914 RepID=UPI0036BC4076